jgi:hypothetical protein
MLDCELLLELDCTALRACWSAVFAAALSSMLDLMLIPAALLAGWFDMGSATRDSDG